MLTPESPQRPPGRPRALARSLFLYRHLAEFLAACASARIGVIVLKGAALAETVYPDIAERPFADLDVLVRPSEIDRAKTILVGLGYAVRPSHWDDIASGRDCQADFAKQTSGGPVILELHTDLINNDLFLGQVRIDVEGLWARSRQAPLAGGAPARILNPADQTLHLCLHLAGHYLAAPRSLRDIAQICTVSDVDWDQLAAEATRAGARHCVYAGLWLAARRHGAPVPARLLTALAPHPVPRRRRLESLATACAADSGETAASDLRLPLLLLLLDRPATRPRVLLRILFPSRRWLEDHYDAAPAARGILSLYGAHLASLLRAAGRRLFTPRARPARRV